MKTYFKTFVSSLLAGLFIGFAGLAFLLISYLPNSSPLFGALIFPFGLILVCLCKTDLFTGKIGFAFNDKELTIIKLLIILVGNLLAAFLFGLLGHFIFSKNQDLLAFTNNLVKIKTDILNISSLTLFFKATICGALVYLAVYLYKTIENHLLKIIGTYIPIFFFVLFGFDHCIANMFYFAFSFSFTPSMILSLLIAIIGNSFGALVINFAFRFISLKTNS